jgi:hypothetical protein
LRGAHRAYVDVLDWPTVEAVSADPGADAGAPSRGGALRVWDVSYAGTDAYEDEDLTRATVTCAYGPGDLVVIERERKQLEQPWKHERQSAVWGFGSHRAFQRHAS